MPIPCPFALKIKYIVNFAFSFSIKIMLMLRQTRVKYENDVVIHRLNISYFSYQAIVIKKNSDDIRIMHPSFTFSINNYQKFHMNSSVRHANKNSTLKMIQMKDIVTVEVKFHNEWYFRCTLVSRNAVSTFNFPSFQQQSWVKLRIDTCDDWYTTRMSKLQDRNFP
jgi:hypothetical protein